MRESAEEEYQGGGWVKQKQRKRFGKRSRQQQEKRGN
jgi:hypothetical protein